MEVNVVGNFNVLRIVAQTISELPAAASNKDNEKGVIIQLSSVAAFDGKARCLFLNI